ncbi:beta strand repeat-containing protein [Sphingobium boeckii]|uniref:Filamentous haemagglutinin FhaB/tRNA nuclease CdiA-like TPS domain-containing protein n=1 Tax=Sphingobium boeckii TaxID=1082345 RepID=A0A7W9AGW3_9SPHN|nr:hypothetical protein [Sphingobium boeckii]MBB5685447.1 hypothetical protein [Sphingobium boeckii]
MRTPLPHLRRATVFASVSTLALAFCSTAAQAQALEGTPNVIVGAVGIDRTVSGVDTITVNSPSAVIDWTPTDTAGAGDIDFLPAGTTANFINSDSPAPYTVLNRIIPADPARRVALNGNVVGRLRDGMGNVSPGGSVWFYSPGGILVGSTAVFDVGSLVLTAADPLLDGDGNFVTGGSFSLAAPPGSLAGIEIANGAQISALSEGSYIAMVAPRITQAGTVTVNGTAAYVAAEAADFTFDQGLFAINVTTGTEAGGTVFQHSGTTTGPSSTGFPDNHRIYMVAIPKNDAITMVISAGGSLGFEPAASAGIENGVVVLSAGHNILSNGFADNIETYPLTTTQANVHITGGTITSRVDGRATTDIFATGTLDITGDIALNGGVRAHIAAQAGQTITITGNASVGAIASSSAPDGVDRTGGQALIYAEGTGMLDITGNATAQAQGFAYSGAQELPDPAGSGFGGEAAISATGGGFVSIGGDASVDAGGYAGYNATGGASGSGLGGTARIAAVSGGQISITGAALATAAGEGSMGGGNGTGGLAGVYGDGGILQIGGLANVSAIGRGGSGGFTIAGDGIGGIAEVGALNGGTVLLGNAVAIDSSGIGGGGSIAGNGTGTRSSLFTRGGTLSVALDAQIVSDGIGGNAESISGTIGTTGTGGIAAAIAETGSTAGSLSVTTLLASARGLGGDGANASSFAGGTGGAGIGGQAFAYAESANNSFTADSVSLTAYGRGGDGGNGGSGVTGQDGGAGGAGAGGLVQAGTISGAGAPVLTGSTTIGDLILDVVGEGGMGGSGGFGSISDGLDGSGGLGTGGQAVLSARGGIATIGDVLINAYGLGGNGGEGMIGAAGGNGIGGSFTVLAGPHAITGAGGTLNAQALTAYADGRGGTGSAAGIGTAGGGRVSAGAGSFLNLDSIISSASGDQAAGEALELSSIGGAMSVAGTASLQTAGDIILAADNGSVVIGGILSAQAGGAFLAGVNGIAPAMPGTLRAGGMTLRSGGAFATASRLASDTRLIVDGGGAVTLGALDAGGDVLVVGNGPVTTGMINAGGDAVILSGGAVTVGGMNAGNMAYIADISMLPLLGSAYDTTALAGQAPVAVNGAISISGAVTASLFTAAATTGFSALGLIDVNDFALDTGGSVLLDDLITAGDFIFDGNGDLTLGDITAAGIVDIGAAGSIITGALSASDSVTIDARGGSAIIGGPVTTGQFAAVTQTGFTAQAAITANGLDVNAGGVATFNGIAGAQQIIVRSADLAVGASGALGIATTETLDLVTDGAMALGGTGGTGYVLDGAEATRLHANAITITGGGTALVRDLALAGSGAGANANLIGPDASLSIQTPGEIRVTGTVGITNAGADDQMTFTSGQRFSMTSEAGSILLAGDAGAPSGMLSINAPDIAIATTALVDQLAMDPFFQGRDTALAIPASPRLAGVIQAGGIRFGVSRSLMIQNTGRPGLLAGFTVGASGMTITSTLPSNGTGTPVDVNIHGRAIAADGTTLINENTLSGVSFETASGAAGFTASSRVNGCALDGSVCAPILAEPIEISPAIQGVIEAAAEALTSEDATSIPDVRVRTVIDTAAFSTETLIEEPVSGGGNSSLWEPDAQDEGAEGETP